MKRVLTFFTIVAVVTATAVSSNADLINEFQPNPPGGDPADQMVELVGTALASFSGFLSSIESDDSSSFGMIDRQTAISGSYDAGGFAVVTIPDLENPSFTFVFSSLDAGGAGANLDMDGDGNIDDPNVFGTVFDAIGIPDGPTGQVLYGSQLGGADFTFPATGSDRDEPSIAFRDGITGNWWANYDFLSGSPAVADLSGAIPNGVFDLDPAATTFGSVNPSFSAIPEPGSIGVLVMVAGLGFIRRRK